MSACMSVTFLCLLNCLHVFQEVRTLPFTSVCVVQMFKGKENYLDLIQELRTVHALQKEEQKLQKADKELVMNLKRQRDIHRQKVKHTDMSTNNILQTPNNAITPSLSLCPHPDLSRGGISCRCGRCSA